MKTVFLLAAIVCSVAANSQIVKVNLQASGLTCSMCSNAINKALKSVDFVDKIEANIKTSNFEITFKPGTKIDLEKLKNKVEGAGFTVSKFIATVHFENVRIKPGEPVVIGSNSFQLVNGRDESINGDHNLRVIDKGFVSSKEYRKNGTLVTNSNGNKLYHVLI